MTRQSVSPLDLAESDMSDRSNEDLHPSMLLTEQGLGEKGRAVGA